MALTQIQSGMIADAAITPAKMSNSGAELGMRNRIINGDMRIDQRNAGGSVSITGGATTLTFGPDRWQVRSAGANASAQQVTVSGMKRLRFTGAASVTAVAAHQRIEAINSADLAGLQVTVSLKASSTSLTSLTLELYYANSTDSFGTWGVPTVTSIGSTSVTINTTEQTVSATFTVPSAATTGLEVRVTGGALLASQTLTIGDIQLELGSNATPFERRLYGQELALCQRYYYRTVSQGVSYPLANAGGVYSTTAARALTTFPVRMRTTPSALEQSGTASDYAVLQTTAAITCSAVPTFNAASLDSAYTDFTIASGGTAGSYAMIRGTTATAYLGWSAEL